MNYIPSLFALYILISTGSVLADTQAKIAEEQGVKYADKCEACKILAIELQGRLQETGKSHDVIETG
jgi:protein canopy 3/4